MPEQKHEKAPAHVHGPDCGAAEEHAVLRCLECELLFEGGIADAREGAERCPQCGLQNAVPVENPDDGAFVIRHSSRFR